MKVAMISGGSSGVGLTYAKRWCKQKNYAILLGRSIEKLDQASLFLENSGIDASKYETQRLDCTDPNALKNFFSHFKKPLDQLICSAGVGELSTFEEASKEDWIHVLEANLLSAVFLCQYALPNLRLSSSPSIITIGSVMGKRAQPRGILYATAKAGLAHFSKSLAKQLAPEKIRVNHIVPAGLDTPMLQGDLSKEEYARFKNDLAKRNPLERIGTAEDVAEAIFYLCSDQASWVTGSEFVIDGGALL